MYENRERLTRSMSKNSRLPICNFFNEHQFLKDNDFSDTISSNIPPDDADDAEAENINISTIENEATNNYIITPSLQQQSTPKPVTTSRTPFFVQKNKTTRC